MLDVSVTVNIVDDYELLPQFLNWYLGMGVSKVLISVNDVYSTDLYSKIKSFESDRVSVFDYTLKKGKLSALDGDYVRILGEEYAKTTWIMPTDLDEFIQLPFDLKSVVEALNHSQSDYAIGFIHDRVSLTGDLTSFDPSVSVWKQYPLVVPFGKTVWKANDRKVVLYKRGLHLTGGHHTVFGSESVWEKHSAVHHFKWRDSVVKHLTKRWDSRKELDGYETSEVAWQIAYFHEHGPKININDLGSNLGWIP